MDVDVDTILAILGPWKRYQYLQLFYIGIVHMFGAAYTVLIYVFIGYQPPHKCSNLTQSVYSYGIPSSVNESQLAISYGECDITVISNETSQQWTIPCAEGYTYDSVDYTFVSEWNLVCSRAGLGELAQTFIAAGQCLGAVLFSSMADRYGRRPVLMGTHLMLFIIAAGTFFIPNYAIFAVSRFILGALQQGVAIILTTILLEMFPKDSRGTIGAVISVFWAIAVVFLTVIGYGLRNYSWRYVQLAVALMSCHTILGYWLIDESLRWLVANNKTAQTITLLKKIAKCNKINVNRVLSMVVSPTIVRNGASTRPKPMVMTELHETEQGDGSIDLLEMTSESFPSVVQHYTPLDILRNKVLLRNSLILWFAWIVNSMTYYGLFLTSSSMAGNRFLNYFINAIVELPSNIMFCLMVNRSSRKTLIVLYHAIAGISLIISVALLTIKDCEGVGDIVSTVFSFLGKFGISASFNLIWMYTPELYPTNLRSAGMGVASTMARIGAMIAPFSSMLAAKVIWGPGVVFGVCCVVVTILGTVLPETRKRELPQTMGEMISWSKEESGWSFRNFRIRRKKSIDGQESRNSKLTTNL